MTQRDFVTSLVKEPLIADLTDQLEYAVISGASSTTFQQFEASTATNSSMIFAVKPPSKDIIIDREIKIKTSIEFQLCISNVDQGKKAFTYGYADSLMPFPLASLMNTASASINNTTVSSNLKDLLPVITRLTDSQHLQKFNSTTPTLPDQFYHSYKDSIDSNANPMASFNNMSYNRALMPRGSYPIESMVVEHNVPAAGGAAAFQDALVTSTGNDDTWVIKLKFLITEPVLLSPFTWCDPEQNGQGLVGINGINFNFNIDSTLSRLWSSANLQATDSSAAGKYYCTVKAGFLGDGKLFQENPSMLVKFLSTQASDKIPAKNVVPYMNMPMSITNSNASIASLDTKTFTTNNLSLDQIPDKFIVVARKPMTDQKVGDSNSFFVIESTSINFNNQAGILSSATQEELWRMSSKNGVSQSWLEFSGKAWDNNVTVGGVAEVGANLATSGSILCMSPPLDLSLPEWATSGSQGSFSITMQITVKNQTAFDSNVELCIIQLNSGFMTTERGQSVINTGILTKEAVLDAKSMKPLNSQTRLVGGSEVKDDRLLGGGVHMSAGAGLSGLY
jgi:hypothetical protein